MLALLGAHHILHISRIRVNVARVERRRNRDFWWGNTKEGGHLGYLSIDWKIILKCTL